MAEPMPSERPDYGLRRLTKPRKKRKRGASVLKVAASGTPLAKSVAPKRK